MNDAGYQKALRFILGRQHFGIKLGLDNISRLCHRLDDPQNAYDSIHIAGTNGKGSTASFLAAILQAAGYRVGLYTSPHLADFRERIKVNGRKISKAALADFINRHRALIVSSGATFFEVATALAFWHFRECGIEWAVLETGLGGRLDATNVVIPKAAVITNVSLEHTHILGRTIYQIAGEKGGIIKPGVPLVTGVMDNGNAAARRFREIAREKGAPVYFHRGGDYECHAAGEREQIKITRGRYKGLSAVVSLKGRHQADNAGLAVRVIDVLASNGPAVPAEAVKKGLESCYWPARFMTVRKRPAVIIDVAHNPDGFKTLRETLDRRFPGRKFHFLLGMVEKKRGDRCFEIIAPLAASISTAPVENERRDDPYFLISRLAPGRLPLRLYPSIKRAYFDLLKNMAATDILIIAGSHFIMGELAPYIKRNGF